MSAHSYWRLHIVSQEGSNFNYMSLWTLDFQDSSGTSLCTGGVALASSHYAFYDPSRIFPGGPGDWVSNNEMACWVGYQFAAPVEPGRVVLSNSNTGNNPVVMELQSSDDGVSWSAEWVLTKPATWTLHSPVTYTAPAPGVTSAPHWGVFVSTMDGGPVLVLAEVAFLDTGGAPLPGAFNQVGCATNAGNYDWSACWDNDPSTSVHAQDTAGPPAQYVTAQYPAPVTVTGLRVTNTTDGFYAQYVPATGALYASVDGLAWGRAIDIGPSNASGYPPPGPGASVTWGTFTPVTPGRRRQLINPI